MSTETIEYNKKHLTFIENEGIEISALPQDIKDLMGDYKKMANGLALAKSNPNPKIFEAALAKVNRYDNLLCKQLADYVADIEDEAEAAAEAQRKADEEAAAAEAEKKKNEQNPPPADPPIKERGFFEGLFHIFD